MPSKFLTLLSSRKFWAALISLGLLSFKNFYPDFPVDESTFTDMTYVIVAYIIGTALESSPALAPYGQGLPLPSGSPTATPDK